MWDTTCLPTNKPQQKGHRFPKDPYDKSVQRRPPYDSRKRKGKCHISTMSTFVRTEKCNNEWPHPCYIQLLYSWRELSWRVLSGSNFYIGVSKLKRIFSFSIQGRHISLDLYIIGTLIVRREVLSNHSGDPIPRYINGCSTISGLWSTKKWMHHSRSPVSSLFLDILSLMFLLEV